MRRSRDMNMGTLDLAKCLMSLSQNTNNYSKPSKTIKLTTTNDSNKTNMTNDVFECKTCNKKFPSFQALGGHRASHKKPKLFSLTNPEDKVLLSTPAKKGKMHHECAICGAEFSMGQALGGHMRRHRGNMMNVVDGSSAGDRSDKVLKELPLLLRRSNSSKRVFGLDLNLTPLENDLEILFGKNLVPKVDYSLIT